MRFEEWHKWLIAACATLVPGIYGLGFHKKLLVEGSGANATAWFFGCLAALGIVLSVGNHFDKLSLGLAAALISPAAHRFAFRRLFQWFVRIVGREPVDVTYNWNPGLAADRAFAFVIFLGCTFGTLGVVGYFIWGLGRARGAG